MGYIIGAPESHGDFIGRLLTDSTTFNRVLQMCAHLPTVVGASTRGAGPSNLLFLFGVRDTESYWYAGLDLSGHISTPYGGGLVIGRYSGGLAFPEAHLSLGALLGTLNRDQSYLLTLDVTVTGSVIEVDLGVETQPTWSVHAETTTDFMFDGQVGFGSYGSSINVHHFGYGDCPLLECEDAEINPIS